MPGNFSSIPYHITRNSSGMDFSTPTFELFTRGLVHEDVVVRDTCIAYFDGRHGGTTQQTAAVLDALERYGEMAYEFIHQAYELPLDATSLDRLFALILGMDDEERRLRLLLWTANAPISLLPAVAEFTGSNRINVSEDFGFLDPQRIGEQVSRRLFFAQLDAEELTGWLESLFAEMTKAEDFPHATVKDAKWVLDAMIEHMPSADLAAMVEQWLEVKITHKMRPEDWKLVLGIHLAGLLRMESKVDRLLDCFDMDWDWANDMIQVAMIRIGTPAVVERIRNRWIDLPEHGQLYLSEVFQSLHPAGYLDFYDRVLEKNTVWGGVVDSALAAAAAHSGTREGLEWALKELDLSEGDPEFELVDETLFTHYELRGWDHSRKAELRESIDLKQENYDDLLESFASSGTGKWGGPNDAPDFPQYPVTPVTSPPKVGRNAPCPCGSGKKFKKCCLDK